MYLRVFEVCIDGLNKLQRLNWKEVQTTDVCTCNRSDLVGQGCRGLGVRCQPQYASGNGRIMLMQQFLYVTRLATMRFSVSVCSWQRQIVVIQRRKKKCTVACGVTELKIEGIVVLLWAILDTVAKRQFKSCVHGGSRIMTSMWWNIRQGEVC